MLGELDRPFAWATRKLEDSPPGTKRLERSEELGARASIERARLVVLVRPGAEVGDLLGQQRVELIVLHDPPTVLARNCRGAGTRAASRCGGRRGIVASLGSRAKEVRRRAGDARGIPRAGLPDNRRALPDHA